MALSLSLSLFSLSLSKWKTYSVIFSDRSIKNSNTSSLFEIINHQQPASTPFYQRALLSLSLYILPPARSTTTTTSLSLYLSFPLYLAVLRLIWLPLLGKALRYSLRLRKSTMTDAEKCFVDLEMVCAVECMCFWTVYSLSCSVFFLLLPPPFYFLSSLLPGLVVVVVFHFLPFVRSRPHSLCVRFFFVRSQLSFSPRACLLVFFLSLSLFDSPLRDVYCSHTCVCLCSGYLLISLLC
jgi:hypothetical protein